jgi:hypothetical protein
MIDDHAGSGSHRYVLERRVLPAGDETLCWLMLNPSTADATEDDPTIRKVKGFTTRAGYGRALVVNLFAWRATDPRDLRRAALSARDVVGRRNRAAIIEAAALSSAVVCAWGALGAAPWARAQVSRALGWLGADARLLCLGLTKRGAPLHPLMLAYDAHPFIPFDPTWSSRHAAVG